MPVALPVFFNPIQLEFKPLYEWAFGERISHPEGTARAEAILAAVSQDPAFELRDPRPAPDSALRALHDHQLITLYETAARLPQGETFHPNVFPRKKRGLGDPTQLAQAGAWCFDSGTPLSSRTLEAARWSAACALDAARTVLAGAPVAYALSRPPGHHAMRDLFGGYCYFNNTALAARALRRRGKVAVVDIDFHHGNGTQELFWRDGRVLTVSIHGDPAEFFPYFVGYPSEHGAAGGAGANHNFCLPRGADGAAWLQVLDHHVLPLVRHFGASALVIAAGLDGYIEDPVGDWALTTADFEAGGERLGRLGLPTVVVQEGGYYTPALGTNAVALLRGVQAGLGSAERG